MFSSLSFASLKPAQKFVIGVKWVNTKQVNKYIVQSIEYCQCNYREKKRQSVFFFIHSNQKRLQSLRQTEVIAMEIMELIYSTEIESRHKLPTFELNCAKMKTGNMLNNFPECRCFQPF